jgi:NADPH:quinone reductase-like Zn-dependent oxidoreductase
VLIRSEHAAPCPPTLDPVQAAALPVNGLTAAQAVAWLGLGSGQRLLVTNGSGATGALAVQLAAAAGVRVTATASPGSGHRLRRLGVAEVLDYHDPHWPQRAGTGFDGALAAAPGTASAAFSLLRAGGRLCSLTSDAPASTATAATENLYVQPDPTSLAELATDVATGRLRMAVQERRLDDGPVVFAQVSRGRAGGWKFVLTP